MDNDFRWRRMQERMARRQERWSRRQARWENRQANWGHRSAAGGVAISIGIIAIGAMFLLDNLGIVRFHDIARYWPVILIALGVMRLVESHGTGSLVFGGLLSGIGGLLLLDNLGIFYFDWRLFWPAILVGFGILMLIRNLEWQDRPERQDRAPRPGFSSSEPAGPGKLNLWTVFGGGQRSVDAKDFRGGEVSAMFGGWEIDLRNAGLADGQATVEVNVMFGGAEIRIPDTWSAEVRGTALFGGFSDETRHPDPAGNPPRLTITGSALFGGVTVSN
jgi:predicted membrane protein